jgi:hypothetical protein
MVRQRSLVGLATSAGLVLAACAFAAVDTSPAASSGPAPNTKTSSAPPSKSSSGPATTAKGKVAVEPIERRPYRIRAWVVLDPHTRLDTHGLKQLVDSWRSLVRRFVGPPWAIEMADDEGPLATETLEGLRPQQFATLVDGYDKAWVVLVEPEGNSLAFAGREFDVLTGRLGPACRRSAPYPADAARALLGLTMDLFEPTAEIGAKTGGGVLITVRGAALPAAIPSGSVVSTGSVFRPLRIWQKPDGSVLKIDDIRRSFLRVTEMNGPVARCDIVSSQQDPLSSRAVRKNRLVALGVKPGSIATRFRYLYASDKTPAAGYILTARTVPDGPLLELGITDREGRVSIPPGFASGLVIFRLLAANIEPVDEFPAMPGETVEERPVLINPKPATVTLETELNSLRDELIDLVATRARLQARFEARAQGEKWDEVEELLNEYGKLTPRDEYVTRLAKLKDDAARQQAETKTAILTRTALGLITDTQALIDRYLDDSMYKEYVDALARFKADEGKGRPSAKGLPKRPLAKASSSPATPTAGAGSGPESTATAASPPPAARRPSPAPSPARPAPGKAEGVVPF